MMKRVLALALVVAAVVWLRRLGMARRGGGRRAPRWRSGFTLVVALVSPANCCAGSGCRGSPAICCSAC